MSDFRSVETPTREEPSHLRRVLDAAVRAINLLGKGKSGNIIDVTLTANSATSVVTNALIGYGSHFAWDPMTANAQAELAANGPPRAASTVRLNGQCTFTHVNSAQTDRSFRVAIIG